MANITDTFIRKVIRNSGLGETRDDLDWHLAELITDVNEEDALYKKCKQLNANRPLAQDPKKAIEDAIADYMAEHPEDTLEGKRAVLEALVTALRAAKTVTESAVAAGSAVARGARTAQERVSSGFQELASGYRRVAEGVTQATKTGYSQIVTPKTNLFGNPFTSIPEDKKQYFEGRLRQRTPNSYVDQGISRENIRKMTPTHPKYGLHKGQYYLPSAAYLALNAKRKAIEAAEAQKRAFEFTRSPVSDGGRRKTRHQKKKRHSKTRRHRK